MSSYYRIPVLGNTPLGAQSNEFNTQGSKLTSSLICDCRYNQCHPDLTEGCFGGTPISGTYDYTTNGDCWTATTDGTAVRTKGWNPKIRCWGPRVEEFTMKSSVKNDYSWWYTIHTRAATALRGYIQYVSDGNVVFGTSDGTDQTTNVAVDTTAVHTYRIVIFTGTTKFYIDNVLKAIHTTRPINPLIEMVSGIGAVNISAVARTIYLYRWNIWLG